MRVKDTRTHTRAVRERIKHRWKGEQRERAHCSIYDNIEKTNRCRSVCAFLVGIINRNVTMELQLWFIILNKTARTHIATVVVFALFFANCNKSFNHPQGFAFARKQQQIMQTNQQTTGKCFLEINWMRVQWFIVQLTRKSLWTNFNWVFFSANSNKIRSKKRSRLNVCMSFPMRIWVRTKMIAIKFTVVSFFPHYVQWTHFVRLYCRQK